MYLHFKKRTIDGKMILSFADQRNAYEEANPVFMVDLAMVVLGIACYLLVLPLRVRNAAGRE